MRYLLEAFWAKMELPYLGAIPLNVVGLAACALLGFGEPAFWPLGAGLEAAYLLVLCNNPRFRQVVDARGKVAVEQSAEAQRAALLSRLNPGQKHRLGALEAKCERIIQIYQDQQVNEFTVSSNSDALKRLQWIFLKLLVAQHYLNDGSTEISPEQIQAKIQQLEIDLKRSGLTRTLRESKEGTVRILQQRLANLNRRAESNAEMESDLGRVEAQVDLALESATMQGQAEVISANVELTSHLLDSSSFGDLSATVDAMDQTFAGSNSLKTATPTPADHSDTPSSSGGKTSA
jgi:hypothetical protein